jgi:hypothetical protein
VKFSASGLTAALEYFMITTAQLERYRPAQGPGLEVGGGQTLKSAPYGYPKDHPRAGLLRCKGLTC